MRMITSLKKGSNASELGKQLVEEIKQGLNGEEIGAAILYVSSHIDREALLKSVREQLENVPLVGCTTGGEFTEKMVEKESASLAVLTTSKNYQYHTAMATGLKDSPIDCVQKVVDSIPAPQLPNRAAILLHDGLAGKGEEAVLSATTILGPKTTFAGGSAGDDLDFKATYVFCNDQIASDSVALLVIDSQNPVAVGVKHGHTPFTEQHTVTKAVDNVLYEVDNEPAWEIWKKELAEKAKELDIDVKNLKDPSEIGTFLIRYELGLVSSDGEYKVRVPLSKNDDGSLNFACTIPQGAKFRIMESPQAAQIASAETAAVNVYKQMDGKPLAGALVFDCVCRAIIMGDQFFKGVEAIKKVIGNIPLIGFETYGEICRIKGQSSGYHNTTTVVMLLPAD